MVRPYYRWVACVLCAQMTFGSPLIAIARDFSSPEVSDEEDFAELPPLEENHSAARPLPFEDPGFLLSMKLGAKGESLFHNLRSLIHRQKFPDLPGIEGGRPSQDEIRAAERELLELKSEIEAALAVPAFEIPIPIDSDTVLPVSDRLKLLDVYFNAVKNLAMLRVAKRQSLSDEWRDRFALLIPRASKEELPRFSVHDVDRFGQRYSLLEEDSGSDGKAPFSRVRVSRAFVQGVEVGALADAPGSENHTTLIQYMAIRQLLENLTELRFLKSSRSVHVPEIPALFQEKLQSMGMLKELEEEKVQTLTEPRMHQSLLRTAGVLPPILTPQVVEGIARAIVGEGNEEHVAAILEPLRAGLSGVREEGSSANSSNEDFESFVEIQTMDYFLEVELNVHPLQVSRLSEEELARVLSQAAANAGVSFVLNRLLTMAADHVILLDDGRRRVISDLMEARRKEYQEFIAGRHARKWARAALQDHEGKLFTFRRLQFIENLMVHATELGRKVSKSYEHSPAEPGVLTRAYLESLGPVQPEGAAFEVMMEVGSVAEYSEARDRFARTMVERTSGKVLYRDTVDPARVEVFLASGDFDPGLKAVKGTSAATVNRMSEAVVEGRKKEIRDLLKYGQWMGFTRAVPLENPKAVQVLSSPSQAADLARYYDVIETSLRSQYPVLMTEVSFRGEEKPLYEVFRALNPNSEHSGQVVHAIHPYLDEALERIETRIHENIRRVAQAGSLDEIRDVVSSATLLQHVVSAFPEFRPTQEQLIERLQDADFVDQLFYEHVGPFLGYGFGAMILLQVTKFGADKLLKKRLRGLKAVVLMANAVASPFTKGMMTWGTALYGADVGFRAYDTFGSKKGVADGVKDLYGSGALDGGFFAWKEREKFRTDYEGMRTMFLVEAGLIGGLVGILGARGLAKYAVGRYSLYSSLGKWSKYRDDVRAFERLGLAPGTFDRTLILRAYSRTLRQVSSYERSIGAEWVERIKVDVRGAARHLLTRTRKGKVWDADILAPQRPARELSRHERKIREALVRLELLK